MTIQIVLRQIEKDAREQSLPIIGGEKGAVLVEVMQKYQPTRVLEIGTLVGYSAILMAQYLPKEGKIVSVDFRSDSQDWAERNIAAAGLDEKIELATGRAQEVIPTLTGEFDLLFIDAEKSEYLEYLLLAEPKLARKALIVADNVGVFRDRVADFLEYVRSNKKYRTENRDFGYDAVEIIEKV